MPYGRDGGCLVSRQLLIATALLLSTGCSDLADWTQSKEDRAVIAAVRAAVETNPSAVNAPTASGDLPLTVALLTRSRSLQDYLLAHGASGSTRDARGDPMLHTAVTVDRPDYRVMRALLARGDDVNVTDASGAAAMHRAAAFAAAAAIDVLLAAGADASRPDRDGRTPLHAVGSRIQPPDPRLPASDTRSAKGQPGAIAASMERLLAAGARLDARDRLGWQPLHHYAWNLVTAAVTTALARGADPVLWHFVPPDDPDVTEAIWSDAARVHFRGAVVVGRDLLEL